MFYRIFFYNMLILKGKYNSEVWEMASAQKGESKEE